MGNNNYRWEISHIETVDIQDEDADINDIIVFINGAASEIIRIELKKWVSLNYAKQVAINVIKKKILKEGFDFWKLIEEVIKINPISVLLIWKSKEIDWEESRKKYEQFITIPNSERLDILFLSLPNPIYKNIGIDDLDYYWVLPNNSIVRTLSDDSVISIGLAKLATEAYKRGWYNVGICHWDNLVGSDKYGDYKLSPNDYAIMALSLKVKVVGISILASGRNYFVEMLIQRIRELAKYSNIPCPEIIVWGPQATFDKYKTATQLGLNDNQVIEGRAVEAMLKYIDNVTWRRSDYENMDYTDLIDPAFLQLPSIKNSSITIGLNVISTWWKSCIGHQACDYCTAYFLGHKIDIPFSKIKQQIDLFYDYWFRTLESNDNFINLAKTEERERFLEIAEYAQNKWMMISLLLTRPDVLASVSLYDLKRIKNSWVRNIFLWIESWNAKTIKAMWRSNNPGHYFKLVEKACEKLWQAGFPWISFSVILWYPTECIIKWDWRRSDRETFEFLTKLKTIIKNCNIDSKILIVAPLFDLSPWSIIAKRFIRDSSNQDALDIYIKKSMNWYFSLVSELSNQYDMSFDELIFSSETQEKILDFLEQYVIGLENLLISFPYKAYVHSLLNRLFFRLKKTCNLKFLRKYRRKCRPL